MLNAENQLTLQLRNLQIPQIENLGITQDKFSVIDLTGNDIVGAWKYTEQFDKPTSLTIGKQ